MSDFVVKLNDQFVVKLSHDEIKKLTRRLKRGAGNNDENNNSDQANDQDKLPIGKDVKCAKLEWKY